MAELIWPAKDATPTLQATRFEVRELHAASEASLEEINTLLHGDNLSAMQYLLPRRRGSFDLIYLDPPFASGVDPTFREPDADERRPAYRDRWPGGVDSYLSMIAPRLALARDLLSERGSLFVHVDYRLSAYLRLLLDECFGPDAFRNEIVWHYHSGGAARSHYPRKHDVILWYARGDRPYFDAAAASGPRNRCPECDRTSEAWNHLKRQTDAAGRVYRTIRSAGKIYQYYDDEPALTPDVWLGINHLHQKDPERTGFRTQKPEKLLRRIVAAHSPEHGLVADFFCGSGTTLAVAERLGRRWLGCDAERLAVHLTRDRLLAIEPRRSFEILGEVEAG
jgi:site-specific DNA-methyltransferase (adenine-specific)/adenine-specific DNA-methyltransferase